ncbi:MAG: flavin reductase family protein [Clostridiales bacterium]|jgi:flavin reductase (DIM6/NTAB) family NADH-FMN oxidoreductase RutF|nr:flavin reductase family protein [Clostridiales bacterium]
MEITENIAKGMSYLTEKGAFLSSKGKNKVNTMTISWGFIGVIWGNPYFITAVRPTRHTKTLLDEGGSFTVSIPWGCLTNELNICGTESGRDIDKSKVVTFARSKQVDAPIVAGCQTYIECVIKYSDPLDHAKMPENIVRGMYSDDYHTLYFGEIAAIYEVQA